MSASPLSGFKIPQEALDKAEVARTAASAATKDIKTAKGALDQLKAAKAALESVNSAPDAATALVAKQDALKTLVAATPKNPRLIGLATAERDKLQELAADFGNKPAVVQAVNKAIKDKEDEISALEAKRTEAAAKADSIIPLKAFERDRTKDNLRTIETDLVKLKTALKDFEDSPLKPSQKCVSDFSGLIIGLQTHVDNIAHENKCHKCQQVNKLPRTDEAKKAVMDKLDALKKLAALPNDSTLKTPAEKADYLLAKSIDQMSKTKDENGETAGKMLGALICKAKNPPPDFEIIYGYSGAVWDQQRMVSAEVERAKKALAVSPDDALLKQALKAAEDKIPAAEVADKAANAALASVPAWAKSLDTNGGVMKSKGGATQTMADLNAIKAKTKGANNIVGACSAPKMIQQAYANGLEPVAMAEAWMGGGSNKDGELVASCDTCMTNIGFQLCEACK